MKELKEDLQEKIDYNIDVEMDLDSASWGYEQGVLISTNQAIKIIELLEQRNELRNFLKKLLDTPSLINADRGYREMQELINKTSQG